MTLPTLAVFDLDHTLLTGDSDVLWVEFLMDTGVLDRAQAQARNADMETRYRAGTVTPEEFCEFFVSTLAHRTRAQWQPLRQRFMDEVIRPRIGADARALVQQHRAAGHTLVLSTATNRFITELTAADLGFPTLIATETALDGERFTGRTTDVLNMRAGKVTRLRRWLAGHGLDEAAIDAALGQAHFYSDSLNDLPLLQAVGHPVVVDPDERLAREAASRAWPVLHLDRRLP